MPIKQVAECHQDFSGDPMKLSFRMSYRNKSPPLPPPEDVRGPNLSIGRLRSHHELPSLIIFENDSLHMHSGSSSFRSRVAYSIETRVCQLPSLFRLWRSAGEVRFACLTRIIPDGS